MLGKSEGLVFFGGSFHNSIKWAASTIIGFVVVTLFGTATVAMAAEAVLVHDIAPPHPRYRHFYAMVAEVASRTSGMLTIACF